MPISSVIEKSAYGELLRVLRGTELEVRGRLPKVVVVGDENHGKSSTIERIAGRAVFPRGNGFTTRVPIKLALRNAAVDTLPFIKIRHFRAPSLSNLAAGDHTQFELLSVEDYACVDDHDHRDDAVSVVSEAMAGIISRCQAEVCDNEMIEIEIAEPNSTDLDLWDLPGIVGAPHDLYTKTRQISTEFIKQSNTIVVCVVSAAQPSLRSSQAMGLVTHMGALDRSITAMTQIDLTTDLAWQASRLSGESSDTKGLDASLICCVRNRDSRKPEEESLALSDETERAWFAEKLESLGDESVRGRLGVGSLLERVNDLMQKHIRKTWVDGELKRVQRLASDSSKALTEMGTPPELIVPLEAAEKFIELFREAWVSNTSFFDRVFTGVHDLINPLEPNSKEFSVHNLFSERFQPSDVFKRAPELYAFEKHVKNSPTYVDGVKSRLAEAIARLLLERDKSDMKIMRFSPILTSAAVAAADIDLKKTAIEGIEFAKRFSTSASHAVCDQSLYLAWLKATCVDVLVPMALVEPDGMLAHIPRRFRESVEDENKRSQLEANLDRYTKAEQVLLSITINY